MEEEEEKEERKGEDIVEKKGNQNRGKNTIRYKCREGKEEKGREELDEKEKR